MPKKTAEDKAIAENDDKIRTLLAVNDALKAIRDAKKKFKGPRPITAKEA